MFRSQPAMVLALLAGAMAPAQAQPVSAFETYRPFADQEVAPWRQSNDTVREIGGWRAYAREAQQQAQDAGPAIPAEPLTQEAAVQLALANSPALKALEADSRANVAAARQGARIANPLFSFERIRSPHELEIGRLLSIGLVELLTLPQRRSVARVQEEQARVRFAAALVGEVARVRQAWVRAVAAGELLAYARQVQQSADASAELARRMQQVGNFTRLQRARQHAFYADASAQLAAAQHAEAAAREELVRLLGLGDAEAARLKLPPRLPDLPRQPRAPADVGAAALQQRLDWQLARLELDAAAKRQGLTSLTSFIDVEAGRRHDTVFAGHRENRKGWELELRLPLFDWGDAQRAAMDAQTLAAASRYEAVARGATSQLRESYSAYRTAYDIARHYRDEIVPLRKTISEENVLRYNGMLIGVFELLADTREQVAGVMAAIHAQQQFWLADAALSAALIGKPPGIAAPAAPATSPANTREGH